MNFSVERTLLGGRVPALLVRPAGSVLPLPAVLWFHGLSADKEVHLPELRRLAAAGLLAIGIDAPGHGERRRAVAGQFPPFPPTPGENPGPFSALVARSVSEVPGLIDALVGSGLADAERIALAGVSMGACAVYGAIAAERRSQHPVRAAVALLGSPAWTRPDTPQLRPQLPGERFFPTALLSISAGEDAIVPPQAARALHLQLQSAYRSQPQRLAYREIPGAAHFLSPEDWESAVAEAGTWLGRWLL